MTKDRHWQRKYQATECIIVRFVSACGVFSRTPFHLKHVRFNLATCFFYTSLKASGKCFNIIFSAAWCPTAKET